LGIKEVFWQVTIVASRDHERLVQNDSHFVCCESIEFFTGPTLFFTSHGLRTGVCEVDYIVYPVKLNG